MNRVPHGEFMRPGFALPAGNIPLPGVVNQARAQILRFWMSLASYMLGRVVVSGGRLKLCPDVSLESLAVGRVPESRPAGGGLE